MLIYCENQIGLCLSATKQYFWEIKSRSL
uniref:Uncharacterized protein n=1 Tax=Rhizophora mucronata TaxID=61149 RepID=A0A2P2N4I0_RHIMU